MPYFHALLLQVRHALLCKVRHKVRHVVRHVVRHDALLALLVLLAPEVRHGADSPNV